MAICERCRAPAEIRLDETGLGQTRTRHFCEACSRESLDLLLPRFETAVRVASEKFWQVLRSLFEVRLGPAAGKKAFDVALKHWDTTFLCEKCSDEGPAILVLRARKAGIEISRLCEACALSTGLPIREVQEAGE